jgi:DNA-binding transcriptional LysR family regulator
VNLEHLRHFLEVAEDMNISSAAKRVRLTQPAMSRQMSVFENDTGWELFERGPKSIRLTRDGEIVKILGAELVRSVDNKLAEIRQEIEGDEIRVGYAPSLGGDLLKDTMSRFVQLHPAARITLADCSSEEMLEGLVSGHYDLIIGVSNDDAAIEWETLRKEHFVLAVSTDHPLARKRKVTPAHLDGERMLLLSRSDYPGYWREVTDYFRTHNINAKVAGEFDGIGSMRLGLEAGIGIALVAARARMGDQVKLKKLTPCPDPICVAAGIKREGRVNPVLRAFIDELKMVAK